MRLTVRAVFLGFLYLTIGACKEEKSDASTVTLFSGVSLVAWENCDATPVAARVNVDKDHGDYNVSVKGYFPCGAELERPWLTLKNNGRTTLVLDSKNERFGFQSNCECSRSLKVQITGRLKSGDTLYVVSNQEVLGHQIIP